MHQQVEPLPSIFSMCDLTALEVGDSWSEPWLADASFFGGCGSPLAPGDGEDRVTNRGDRTSPFDGAPAGPACLHLARASDAQDQPVLLPLLAVPGEALLGVCAEARQSLAGKAQLAAFEEHHLQGGDLRSELLRENAAARAPTPPGNLGQLSGGPQAGVPVTGWLSANGSTFLEASQVAAIRRMPAAGSAVAAPCAGSAPASVTGSLSIFTPLAAETALLESDARSREVAVALAGAAGAPAAATRSLGSTDSDHSTVPAVLGCHMPRIPAATLALTPANKAAAPLQSSASGAAPKRPGAPRRTATASDSDPEPAAKRAKSGSRYDELIDPSLSPEERRRQRRMLSNRESARRSRRKKESFLQTAEEQLAELAAARAFAAADAEEAARKLAQLHVDLAAVAAERDQLRAENKLLFRKLGEAGIRAGAGTGVPS